MTDQIDKPGIYDISAEAYHADPCAEPSLSASIANELVTRSPLHAWTKHPRINPEHESEQKDIYDLGSAAHNMVLRQDFWREQIEIVNAPDWRTKAAREAKAAAREAGRYPILVDQHARLDRMVSAIERHPNARLAFTKGTPEQTLVWRDKETGAWMRCRPDWEPHDPAMPWPDYKTTADARPGTWDRRFQLDHGGLLRAAFYEEGIRQVCGVARPTLFYVVQEVQPPYAVVCHVMPSDSEAMVIARAMFNKARHVWASCLEADEWPSYPLINTMGLSEWAVQRLGNEHHDWKPKAKPEQLEEFVP